MKIWVTSAVVLLCCLRGKPDEISVSAKEAEAADGAVSAADRQVLADYKEYLDRLDGIERQADIGRNGFAVIEEQIFPLETECFGAVSLVPAIERRYHRLALFFIGEDGSVVYRTDQLEANNWNVGVLEQPVVELGAVSFQDLNQDGKMDIVLIVSCKNKSGDYASRNYNVGDVLFQALLLDDVEYGGNQLCANLHTIYCLNEKR